jgi:hypothetical protein
MTLLFKSWLFSNQGPNSRLVYVALAPSGGSVEYAVQAQSLAPAAALYGNLYIVVPAGGSVYAFAGGTGGSLTCWYSGSLLAGVAPSS